MKLRTLLVCLTAACCLGCSDISVRKLASESRTIPDVAAVDIADNSKFLNDLKLSPLWKVEKARYGLFRARPRWIESEESFSESEPVFLYELLGEERPALPSQYEIRNSISPVLAVEIAFGNLRIHNTASVLRLSITHEIYLILHEQQVDQQRSKLRSFVEHIATVAQLPLEYRVDETYRRFFNLFFQSDLKDHGIRRIAGIQGRDTFCGYLKSEDGVNYEGVSVRITEPSFDPDFGECTMKALRLQKAEYLGNAHFDADHLFFLIEDNAVYVPQPYQKRYGYFSGAGSFFAALEILDGDEKVLIKRDESFTGWER